MNEFRMTKKEEVVRLLDIYTDAMQEGVECLIDVNMTRDGVVLTDGDGYQFAVTVEKVGRLSRDETVKLANEVGAYTPLAPKS